MRSFYHDKQYATDSPWRNPAGRNRNLGNVCQTSGGGPSCTRQPAGILNEQRAITADTSLRLARFFGTTPEFWLNLQTAYELRRTRLQVGERVGKEVQPHV
jgi:hypothetical protein